MKTTVLKKLVVPTAIFLLGIGAGYTLAFFLPAENHTEQDYQEIRLRGYQFTNPLLECDSAEKVFGDRIIQPYKQHVAKYIQEELSRKVADDLSVYFRELNDGQWFTIGDIEEYEPVSLLKVPLMIAIFKEAENSAGILTRKIKFSGLEDFTAVQRIKPTTKLVSGREYTVNDLVYRMIVYSDNNAFMLLEGTVDPALYQKVYADFGIPMPYFSHEYRITVRQISSFFRILFNASYLNREMSEKALELLSQAEYSGGLKAGLPPGIAVAHKFGEGGEKAEKELHDCGIIYYPDHPYLLCVMSQGGNYDQLEDAITSVSRIVYAHVQKQYGAKDHQELEKTSDKQ